MGRLVVWRLYVNPCPGGWTLLPWIATLPTGSWRFSWLFFALARLVLEASDE